MIWMKPCDTIHIASYYQHDDRPTFTCYKCVAYTFIAGECVAKADVGINQPSGNNVKIKTKTTVKYLYLYKHNYFPDYTALIVTTVSTYSNEDLDKDVRHMNSNIFTA